MSNKAKIRHRRRPTGELSNRRHRAQRASTTSTISPESPDEREMRALLTNLLGDDETLRKTLVDAFHDHWIHGFRTLYVACLVLPNVELCKRLMAILAVLRHFSMLQINVPMALCSIAAHAYSEEVKEEAERVFATVQSTMHVNDIFNGRPWTHAATKSISDAIAKAIWPQTKEGGEHVGSRNQQPASNDKRYADLNAPSKKRSVRSDWPTSAGGTKTLTVSNAGTKKPAKAVRKRA
jgi:hypothetical protein